EANLLTLTVPDLGTKLKGPDSSPAPFFCFEFQKLRRSLKPSKFKERVPHEFLTARAAACPSSCAPPDPVALAPRHPACRCVRCAASAFRWRSPRTPRATSARAPLAWRYDARASAASGISTPFAKAESDRTPVPARWPPQIAPDNPAAAADSGPCRRCSFPRRRR